jgi:hypothetical protein
LEPKKRGKLFFFASILLADQCLFTASTWLHFLHGKIDPASSIIQLQFLVFSAQDVYLQGRMSISEQQPAGISLCLQQNTNLVCTLWDKLHKLMGIQGLNACSLEKMSRADEATEFTE